jgi:mRNA interferase MazF
MNVRRGEVVIVDFPYSDQIASKIRPALVVQANLWNQKLDDTILAPITSSHNLSDITPTQYFIDILTPEGQQTGLILNSVVRCGNLITYNQSLILRIIGRLSPHAMQQIDGCLKAALGIP